MEELPKKTKVRFVCISDTHNHAPGEGYTLPKGDILIHAGDLTNRGSYREIQKAAEWIGKADFAAKIVVAGNHDLSLDPDCTSSVSRPHETESSLSLLQSLPNTHYLQHSPLALHLPSHDLTLNFFASPSSPSRGETQWSAFQYSDLDASYPWDSIPADTDVLVTHTPPAGLCDGSAYWTGGGCGGLRKALRRVRPALAVCGHCHEGRGAEAVRWAENGEGEVVRKWEDGSGKAGKKQALLDLTGRRGGMALDFGRETAVVNASIMARSWQGGRCPKEFNKPIVVDVDFTVKEDTEGT